MRKLNNLWCIKIKICEQDFKILIYTKINKYVQKINYLYIVLIIFHYFLIKSVRDSDSDLSLFKINWLKYSTWTGNGNLVKNGKIT